MPHHVDFTVGQRWLSNAESELGLGVVISLSTRTVEIVFPATEETRHYARQNPPLTRVTFAPGETITSVDGWQMTITDVQHKEGLLYYLGHRDDNGSEAVIAEIQLDHHYQLNQPELRLLNQQLDSPKWFSLREACHYHRFTHVQSGLVGFASARVQLIPHQLHIAREVGQRAAPRVLLADEVGLGKTIEAALIIQQQLFNGLAQRVLIIVPDSLVHQWLVELLRKVNLSFSVFDEERFSAVSEEQQNPFDNEQLILCSLDFLAHHQGANEAVIASQWDLVVVDEAHHLRWDEHHPSTEYQLVETLAAATRGILLLTATPDQLGHMSHFARLRLLDPARFHSYTEFVEQENQYAQLADAVTPLLSDAPLSDSQLAVLEGFVGVATMQECDVSSDVEKQRLLQTLIDRHGTGRMLFRNSRAGIAGFPQRQLHAYPLDMPEQYTELTYNRLAQRLVPETCLDKHDWIEWDTRVGWWHELLASLRPAKVLTICASASTARALAESLRTQTGIRHTVFDESMSIIERDKAANYFAQQEDGAQVLICSEIGSEGRNFQFAHHLVLFDLPLLPDLLEQRIGRLDRIGQKQDVQIHVPYFKHSAQQVLFNWYHDGLNAFASTCPIGTSVYEQVKDALHYCLVSPDDTSACENLLAETHSLSDHMRAQLEQGRDRLLELNSSGKGRIDDLLLTLHEADQSPTLERFMTRLFDAIGVLQEDKDETTYLLRPTEALVNHLPGLDEEGLTVTYERQIATQLEHVHFLSWDHPLVQHAIDLIIGDVQGSASIATISDATLPNGSYFIETLYVIEISAPKRLQPTRFLPVTPIRLCLDANGEEFLNDGFIQVAGVKQDIATKLINALRPAIEQSVERCQHIATDKAELIKAEAQRKMQAELDEEIVRMKALQKVNPAIRDDEIDYLCEQRTQLHAAIADAGIRLDAVRLLVNMK
ncbi:RNA polymerase-associated protein RapA [Aestuariibacter salexigens]|uniref:RNA polymerase-associated protein RapA n=1 Tax=Aestuariibacter salexigens TaxID=226010 RepID=UPI00040B9E5B|nr:RNA polymerase-associated protein RapA [Aestuariibacter salexigens]